jgi:hypothetical protein
MVKKIIGVHRLVYNLQTLKQTSLTALCTVETDAHCVNWQTAFARQKETKLK